MENLIIYGIVAIVVIVNIVRNYQKEAKKNKERVLNPPRPRSVITSNQENTERNTNPAPFSKPRKSALEEANRTSLPETSYSSTVENVTVRPQVISSIEYNSTQEGVSALDQSRRDEADERRAFMQEEDKNNQDLRSALNLETKEDLQRAFIHSIVLERRY